MSCFARVAPKSLFAFLLTLHMSARELAKRHMGDQSPSLFHAMMARRPGVSLVESRSYVSAVRPPIDTTYLLIGYHEGIGKEMSGYII